MYSSRKYLHVKILPLREEKGCIANDKISGHRLCRGQRVLQFSFKSYHVLEGQNWQTFVVWHDVLKDTVKGMCNT